VIGALYLDSGLRPVEGFVSPLFDQERETILYEIFDPKSRLQEWAQSEKMGTPRYETIGSRGPDHAKQFDVEVEVGGQPVGRGSGSSKRAAEQAAALNALESLGVK
jgi:ribonuclease-3